MPTQTFTTIAQLLNYINTFVVTNGNEEISGEIENNVENALANFIVSYTLNSQKAGISSSTGVVSLSKPFTVFTVVPTSIQWPDNVQFEYYIINATASVISLSAGYSYIDSFGNPQTSIPAHATIHIAKMTNGSWIQANNLSTNTSSNINPIPIQFTIGQPGSLMNAGDTALVLGYNQLDPNYIFVYKDGNYVIDNQSDRFSYTFVFTGTNVTITFNQAVANGEIYTIKLVQLL